MLVAYDHRLSAFNIGQEGGQSSQSSSATKKPQNAPFYVQARGEPVVGHKGPDHALKTENSWGAGAKITSMIYSEADKKVYVGGYNKKITVLNFNSELLN